MFNIFKFIIIALVFATMYQIPFTAIALASVIGFLATVYYTVVFLNMSGIVANTLRYEDTNEIKVNVITVLSNITGVVALYMITPYDFVALLATPWVTITFFTLVLSVLVHYGIVEIENVDEQQEDDDEDRD